MDMNKRLDVDTVEHIIKTTVAVGYGTVRITTACGEERVVPKPKTWYGPPEQSPTARYAAMGPKRPCLMCKAYEVPQ